jgi:Ner family transcriptional regulator
MSLDLQRHELIRAALHRRGWSISRLAREHGCSRPCVTRVSQGRSRSRAIEARIAAALDTTPEQLFPERYPPAQEPWQDAA